MFTEIEFWWDFEGFEKWEATNGSVNALLPNQHQAITSANYDLYSCHHRVSQATMS